MSPLIELHNPGRIRGLLFDIDETLTTDGRLTAEAYGAMERLKRAGKLLADLQFARVDEILATGLHAYLTQFLDRVNELGWRISQDFLVPTH